MIDESNGLIASIILFVVALWPLIDILSHLADLNRISIISSVFLILILILTCMLSAAWFLIEWHERFN
jgi:predicted PurR-regulated permease PerM